MSNFLIKIYPGHRCFICNCAFLSSTIVDALRKKGGQKMTGEDFQKFVIEHPVRLSEGQEEMRQNVSVLENELTEKISALFDSSEVRNNVNDRIITSLDRIEAKINVLQL